MDRGIVDVVRSRYGSVAKSGLSGRQAGVRADRLGVLHQLDGLGSGIGAGTRNYRNAPGRVLDREADQLLVFVEVDRGRFAGSADDDDALRALGDVPIDQALEARVGLHEN